MNRLVGEDLLDPDAVARVVEARDREIANAFSKDAQIVAIRGARRYLGDRLIRVAAPHRLLDPKAGPLIAVHLSILTRKTLGGLETDLAGTGPAARRRAAARRLRRGRGRRIRRWRDARLQRAGGHVPRRLPVLRTYRGAGGRPGGRMSMQGWSRVRRIDLNADLGEERGDDRALLQIVTSANIATGAHAGGGAVLVGGDAGGGRGRSGGRCAPLLPRPRGVRPGIPAERIPR